MRGSDLQLYCLSIFADYYKHTILEIALTKRLPAENVTDVF